MTTVGKMVDAGIDISRLRELLAASGVTVEPLLEEDANWPAPCVRSMEADRCRWATAVAWL